MKIPCGESWTKFHENKAERTEGETTMKSKEELNALKKEIETLNEKLKELTEEELALVSGGVDLPGDKLDIQFVNEKGISIADKFS